MSDAKVHQTSEDVGRNPSDNPTMGDIVAARFGRRDMLRGVLAVSAISAVAGPSALAALSKQAAAQEAKPSFTFTEVAFGVDETHHVAPGYDADVLIRWGDPVVPGAPAFDPLKQSAATQALQFGYNNDFLGFAPLPQAPLTQSGQNADHGLLCVNHEYTDEEVMFPGLGGEQQEAKFVKMTKELVDIEIAAHGGTVVEIKKVNGKWTYDPASPFNRRITGETECVITGPAAGHALLKTSYDPSGTKVRGMLNNCAGGMSPWGTWLTAEENINGYFWSPEEKPKTDRMGVPGKWYNWGAYHDRFDVTKEPNEANRFGWIVEIDPYDPTSTPRKRTALGRFKHEACSIAVNKDNAVVAYMGDDERFDYVYKFVAAKKYAEGDRAHNMTLLDEGTLHVARFDADGSVEWLPLVFGQGPLTPENGFKDQAEVLINARLAGDKLGATKMDRPEDVEVNPKTGAIYINLTNNSRRKPEQVDGPNPRAANQWGQIVELLPPDGDHTATKFSWSILIKAGDPKDPAVGALFNPATSDNGWFSCPDNFAVDSQGRLWVATDQGESWAKTSGKADGIYAVETAGPLRGKSMMFYRVPVGAEMCGPCFTPDDKTLFVAVQHPAVDGVEAYKPFGRKSTFEDPATRWPDFKPDLPPRPSVVALTKQDGGAIGS